MATAELSASAAASSAAAEDPLPATEETEPDADGIKTVTKYFRRPDGVVQKHVSRVRVVRKTVRVSAAALAREKRMKRFGKAVGENSANTTSFDHNLVKLRRPGDEDDRDKDVDELVAKLKGGMVGKRGAAAAAAAGGSSSSSSASSSSAAAANSSWARRMEQSEAEGYMGAVQAAAADSNSQRFVPSAVRNARAAGGDASSSSAYEETPALKISNLADTTTSEDLEEVFGEFGKISRANVVINPETFESRGYGFVNFVRREDAQRAMDELTERKASIGGLVMSIEWSRKQRSTGTTFRSGYGQALPQSSGGASRTGGAGGF